METLQILLAGVLFFVNPFPLDALGNQSVAMVRGTVIERPSQRRVPRILVYAWSSEQGVETVSSNSRGEFFFLRLLPGNYVFFVNEPPLDCSVLQYPKELDAGFEYVATIYMGEGCRTTP